MSGPASSGGAKGRGLRHPGPAAVERLETCGFSAVPVGGKIAPGETVLAGLDRILDAAACEGAVFTLGSGALGSMAYVGPALSPDEDHAVWYSEVQVPAAGAAFEGGAALAGRRDGERFVHCHGLWRTSRHPSGTCGHLLCERTKAATPLAVSGLASRSARFETRPDAETNFSLFAPVGEDDQGAASFYLRVRPHEEIGAAIAAACSARGVTRAEIFGLGSLNGVAFADGTRLQAPATEFFIEKGTFENGRVDLDVCAVDRRWQTYRGRLSEGENPVCVTCELAVAFHAGMRRE